MEVAHQAQVVHQTFNLLRNKEKLAHQELMVVTVNKLTHGVEVLQVDQIQEAKEVDKPLE